MKNRTVKAILAGITTALLVGCNTIAVTDNRTDYNNINTEITTDCISNDTELKLYISEDDNNNYEADQKESEQTQIYYISCEEDHNRLLDVLENRNGEMIIEVSTGTVINSDGDGMDVCGYYRHYDMNQFEVGDKVESTFIYNPDTNCIDDILYRLDRLMK